MRRAFLRASSGERTATEPITKRRLATARPPEPGRYSMIQDFAPDGMADRVADYVKTHDGVELGGDRVGKIADIVYRGLAVKYRWGVETLEAITGGKIDTLYIVGGGGKNELLNAYTANALQRAVRIGASEGTVIGNLLVQAMGMGAVKDLWELREVVANSFDNRAYHFDPAAAEKWAKAYKKLLKLMGE